MSRQKGKVKAIIVAAGAGKRFGGSTPKQFRRIAGAMLLEYSIFAFQLTPDVDEIVVVLPERYLPRISRKLRGKYAKISHIVAGGQERSDSVLRGIEAAGPASVYLIHDGVRPCVRRELIRRVIRGVLRYGAAIPALVLHDTVKEINASGFVRKTLKRESLRSVQTPQGFRREIIDRIVLVKLRAGVKATDEAALAEMGGIRVKTVEGDSDNLKVTTEEDLTAFRMMVEREHSAVTP